MKVAIMDMDIYHTKMDEYTKYSYLTFFFMSFKHILFRTNEFMLVVNNYAFGNKT